MKKPLLLLFSTVITFVMAFTSLPVSVMANPGDTGLSAADNQDLVSLSVRNKDTELLKDFVPSTHEYSFNVGYETESVTVEAVAKEGDTVTGTGSYPLETGSNTITVTNSFDPGDGSAPASTVYTLTIKRAAAEEPTPAPTPDPAPTLEPLPTPDATPIPEQATTPSSDVKLGAAGDTGTTIDGWKWRELSDGTLEITGKTYIGLFEHIITPGNINGKTVTQIGYGAFAGSDVEYATIADGVKIIGINAFAGCDELSSITMPDSVTTIGENAFKDCTSLPNITLSNNLAMIQSHAFETSGLTSLTLPNSLTSIGAYAFAGCFNLENVSLPTNNSLEIWTSAFTYCTRLGQITLPSGVYCNAQVFEHCSQLSSVTMPQGPIDVPQRMFAECTALKNIDLSRVSNIGNDAFYNCTGLTDITLDTCQSIGSNAFWNCHLHSLTINTMYTVLDTNMAGGATIDCIYCFSNSTAEAYAKAHGILYHTRYKVDFSSNGGDAYVQSAIAEPWGYITLPATAPTRLGYYFVGWYKEPTCKNPWNFSTDTVTSNITLYAKWAPASSYLSDINLTAGLSFTRPFVKTRYSYTIILGEHTDTVRITPVKEYSGAAMTIDGNPSPYVTLILLNGELRKFKIKVTNLKVTKTYTVTVKRVQSTNNYLGSLTSSAAPISPTFNKDTPSYTVELPEVSDRTTITASAELPGLAKVYYPSKTYILKNNQYKKVTIKVKSQAGKYRYYTITIHRAPSTNNYLASLTTSSSAAPLGAQFNPEEPSYSVILPKTLRTLTISCKAATSLAKVSMQIYYDINGKTIYKKSNKVTVLNTGKPAYVIITVTAQSGETRSYGIDVYQTY